MKKHRSAFFLTLLFWFIRFCLSLRYRIVVKGLDQLHFKPNGTLFLPNHPAEMDPIIMELILWKKFHPRPLVVEQFYHLKGFRWFMDQVEALPLPAMDEMVSKWRAKRLEKQFEKVALGLKSGDSFLIYPSGRLKITGMELLGGASFVHQLLQKVPETNIILVRTTGLWGSVFSKALTGKSPNFGKTLFQCAKILIKNGIFFVPKREVLVEFANAPADFPYQGTKRELNKYLENWYNRYPVAAAEPLKLVSYAFWKKDLPTVITPKEFDSNQQTLPISSKIQKEVSEALSKLCGKPATEIERNMLLSQDLGLDSLDVVQVYVFLDERYGVNYLVPGDLQTVEDVLQYAAGYKKPSTQDGQEQKSFSWPHETRRAVGIPESTTLQEAFLLSAELGKKTIACMDALTGPLSYSKLKIAALLFSEKIKQLPGDKIGILLPSSSATYLIILGVLLANKIPVMLNWTSGIKALDHAVDLTHLKVVISSEKFLDRLEGADFGKMEQMLHLLEEMRFSISIKDKLTALYKSTFKPQKLLKKLGLERIDPTSPCVILFTSGTESLPKGVPLSHNNILSNQRAALKAVELSFNGILYGVLPAFHSFGFSVTGLLPLLAGIRIFYAPDPTDSHGMARDVGRYKPTLFCCAPSFIRALFQIADPAQLQSLQLIVSGAEKTPQDLFDFVEKNLPHARLLEGYGITECSPVVTLDRPGEPHKGVGRAIPGVELMILDQNTQTFLPPNQEGEVCIAGPNVFAGYLGSPRNPFICIQDKKWYLSGDRGSLDEKGYLTLSGRLKRFIKIGGEMVSLGGLEEELIHLAKDEKWINANQEGPFLAVSAREQQSEKPQIILFTTFAISKENINNALKKSGYGRIVKIAQVHTIDQIPLTGAGKTHYSILDEMPVNS